MPDANKIAKLEEIAYRVQPCCGSCKYGRFPPGLDWGSCTSYTYHHLKHKESKHLSVNRAGRCSSFKFNEKKKADLERSGFLTFVEELLQPPQDLDEAYRVLRRSLTKAVRLATSGKSVPRQTINEWLVDIIRGV